MKKSEAEEVLKDTIIYANAEIKKEKKISKNIFDYIWNFSFVNNSIFVIFKYETPVKYSKDIINVNIPIDVNINLNNYKNANAILIKNNDNTYDLYINVTQTLSTIIFDDKDKTNNLLRAGNRMIVDFQSERLRGFLPDGSDTEDIQHIYYIDNSFDKIANMDNSELINIQNKILIWERD